MRASMRLPAWVKAVEVSFLAMAICVSLGAATPSGRLNDLSHRLMCQCGCAQLLGECDHYGCPDRDEELSMLTTEIGAGLTDQEILDSFVTKYGATVLAAPTAKGFDLVAWIAPFAVFAAALLGTILLVRRWGGLGRGVGKPQPAGTVDASFVDPEERKRLARIRRETDVDAGSRRGFDQ